jgi:phage shock protein C
MRLARAARWEGTSGPVVPPRAGGDLQYEPVLSKEWIMEPTRKLYRSRKNRKMAGVCGGLADYLNVDPTLIRVLFIVLAVMGGAGAVIYLAMWIVVPEEP